MLNMAVFSSRQGAAAMRAHLADLRKRKDSLDKIIGALENYLALGSGQPPARSCGAGAARVFCRRALSPPGRRISHPAA